MVSVKMMNYIKMFTMFKVQMVTVSLACVQTITKL